jgi:hypothetical protein
VKNGQKAERKRAALLCEQITKQKHDHYDVDFVGWRVEREWELQSLPRGCILSVEILKLTFWQADRSLLSVYPLFTKSSCRPHVAKGVKIEKL